MNRAIDLCNELRGDPLHDFYVSSDIDWAAHERYMGEEPAWRYGHALLRPAELAQDDTPMIAVVQHVLQQIPGEPDDIIVLLQPTQPLRTPEHVRAAVRLLRETNADSVVSVVELPKTHDWTFQLRIEAFGRLVPWIHRDWTHLPTSRQEVLPSYIRDGTVYAFWRRTVQQYGDIYGQDVRPLIIDPADSCELDSEADWAALEARWSARATTPRS